MSEFRWLLLAAGLAVLGLVFWWSKREASGKPLIPPSMVRRKTPGLTALDGNDAAVTTDGGDLPGATVRTSPTEAQRIVAVRLIGKAGATFSGEALLASLCDAGLRHGRFGIFHRHDPANEAVIIFSVASLVEPGSFDLGRVKTERFPGVSFFLPLPAASENVVAFDEMMSTAHSIAMKLDGQLLDEQGSRLSVQRERFLREEVIQFHHKRFPS